MGPKKKVCGEAKGKGGQSAAEKRREKLIYEREFLFREKMRKQELGIHPIESDGNCLYRAVAQKIFGDQENFSLVKLKCFDYMQKNKSDFAPYVESGETMEQYIARKRKDCVWGNEMEIKSIVEAFQVRVLVYGYTLAKTDYFFSSEYLPKEKGESSFVDPEKTVHLSFQFTNHYNLLQNIPGTLKIF